MASELVRIRRIIATSLVLCVALGCQPDAPVASDPPTAPAGWPLAIGDVIDSRTFYEIHDRFKDTTHGAPQFEMTFAKNAEPDGGIPWACLAGEPEDPKNPDDVIRRVQGRFYPARHLPEGLPCDLDALYTARWVYRGHK